MRVLQFAGPYQAVHVRGLDSQKDAGEAGPDHQVQQFRVRGQVHRGLGEKIEGMASRPHPGDQLFEEVLGLGGTADEVVVHKEDVASPAKIVQHLQFFQDLAGSLGAHPASQHQGDVAEFAVKRAAPGELQGHIQVAVQVNQVKAGRRGMLQVRMARRDDDFARLAPLQTSPGAAA